MVGLRGGAEKGVRGWGLGLGKSGGEHWFQDMKSNVLLSVLALSLALLSYTERSAAPPPTSEGAQEISSEPLFDLSPEEISAVTVVDRSGCLVVRQEALTLPQAEALIESLLQARVIRRFSPDSPDLSPYGLTLPGRRVAVEKTNGERSQVIDLGSLNPIGTAVYVRVQNDPDVLLVGSYLLTSLDMALQGLQAKGNSSIERNCSYSAAHG